MTSYRSLSYPNLPSVRRWNICLSSQQPPVQNILLSALVVAHSVPSDLCLTSIDIKWLMVGRCWMSSSRANFLSFHGSFPYSDRSVRTEMTGAGRHAGLVIVRTWHLMDFVFYKKHKKMTQYTCRKRETTKKTLLWVSKMCLINENICVINIF